MSRLSERPALKKALSLFSTPEKILIAYNPSNQWSYTTDLQRVFYGEAPTLAELDQGYGEGTARKWASIAIADLSKFAGTKGKIEPQQQMDLSNIIATSYADLKMTELMLFFRFFKEGKYGKFYGNVDPITIAHSLRKFYLEDKPNMQAEVDRKKEAEEKARRDAESRKNAISYEEYQRRKAEGII